MAQIARAFEIESSTILMTRPGVPESAEITTGALPPGAVSRNLRWGRWC